MRRGWPDDWSRFHAPSQLGGSLLREKKLGQLHAGRVF